MKNCNFAASLINSTAMDKNNSFSKVGDGCYSLVQCIIGHGVFGVKGDNDGFVKRVLSAPSPFKETQNIRK